MILKQIKKTIISLLTVSAITVAGAATSILPYSNSMIFKSYALSGDGTKDSPYEIYNATDLYTLQEKINESSNIYVELRNDINLNPDTSFNINNGSFTGTEPNSFTPIENFGGDFNGNGHTIKGLYIKDVENAGLFGKISQSANIHDVKIEDSVICGTSSAGGICGYISKGINVTNCSVSAYISGNKYAGGIVGRSELSQNATFENVSSVGNINGKYAGGIIGYCKGTSKKLYFNLNNSYTTANLTSNESNIGTFIYCSSVNSYLNISIKNCFYSQNYDPVVNASNPTVNAEKKEISSFNNGEVAYLLNEDKDDPIWGQEIGVDLMPVLNGKKVYYNENNETQKYFNDSETHIHNFGNSGKCIVCGEYQDGFSSLYGNSATLDGTIGFNFYMEIDDSFRTSNTIMVFEVSNSDGNNKIIKIPYSDDLVSQDNNYIVFTCPLASKQMSDTVKAHLEVYDDSGNVIKSGTNFENTIENYLVNGLPSTPNYDEKLKQFSYSILNFGAASQELFNYNTNYLANRNLSEEEKHLNNIELNSISSEDCKITNNENYTAKAKYYGSSLVLNSGTDIKHYFYIGDSAPENFSCTVKLVGDDNTIKTTELEKDKSGKYLIARINNIDAASLTKRWEFVFKENDTEVCTVQYSAYGYILNTLKNHGNDTTGQYTNQINCVKALYYYADWAYKYVNNMS